MNFYTKLENLLKAEPHFVDQEGDLLKSNVLDLAYKADKRLIEILLSDKDLKNKFFSKISASGGKDSALVFNINDFVNYIQDKNFLADSYTRYCKKIGFNIKNKFLNERKEVALVWPFKDCVLEGGQTHEDAKRKEIFFNEILAQDEIDKLLDPKVLVNWKRYSQDGGEDVKSLKRDADGTIQENFIIKGNNLLALHSLKEQFQNKVKLIYIDPPYNTGNDSFGYNDNFNHSTWLTFMKNRLEVARELLREDGSIWINIDDNESHYLKVLCDEIFGRDNFVGNVIWQKKYTIANDAKWFSDNHDHILVFAKEKSSFSINGLQRTQEQQDRYVNCDNDSRGPWMTQPLHAKSGNTKNFQYTFKNGIVWSPPHGTFPRYSRETLKRFERENLIWFGAKGDAVPRVKKYLSDMSEITPATIWPHTEVGNNDNANREIKLLGFGDVFSTPKPEKLLQRILEIGSNQDDIILDFFSGSGTSLAVAHKTGRQYIGIEQMDYIHELPEARLKKVIGKKVKKSGKLIDEIEFDEGGISKAVKWRGGGEFIYCELMEYNEKFVDKIKKADTTKKLLNIWENMKEKSFLNYNVDLKKFEGNIDEFKKLSIDKQKRTLLDFLNKNQLYTNLSEIKDIDFKVSKGDQRMNEGFYGEL